MVKKKRLYCKMLSQRLLAFFILLLLFDGNNWNFFLFKVNQLTVFLTLIKTVFENCVQLIKKENFFFLFLIQFSAITFVQKIVLKIKWFIGKIQKWVITIVLSADQLCFFWVVFIFRWMIKYVVPRFYL